jgi:hypothetical protein
MAINPLAEELAVDCLAVGWEVDDIGALVAEVTGMSVRDAWGIAYKAKTWDYDPVDARGQAQSAARLSEVGIGRPGDAPIVEPSKGDVLRGAIDAARELWTQDRSEAATARALVEEYFLPPQVAALAAAVAATDPR